MQGHLRGKCCKEAAAKQLIEQTRDGARVPPFDPRSKETSQEEGTPQPSLFGDWRRGSAAPSHGDGRRFESYIPDHSAPSMLRRERVACDPAQVRALLLKPERAEAVGLSSNDSPQRHHLARCFLCGGNSVGRVPAFQAECHGFESHPPLQSEPNSVGYRLCFPH